MNKVTKILGIDYGSLTIGLAIYDVETDFIYPLKTIKRSKENILRESLREIADIIDKENISKIVIGFPLSMDDSTNDRTILTKSFADKLKLRISKDIDIVFQDERLTSVEAKEILDKNNRKLKDQKKDIDQIAAMIILKDYKSMENENKRIENTITFDIDGTKKEVEVLEQTVIDNVTYLLVCEKDIEDGDCFVLKDVSKLEDAESIFEPIDDEKELNKVYEVFKNVLKDDSINLE